MRMLGLVAVVVGSVAGCAGISDRVVPIASEAGEHHFKTYCRRIEACQTDAKVVCKEGYVPEDTKEHDREFEYFFRCHGHTDY